MINLVFIVRLNRVTVTVPYDISSAQVDIGDPFRNVIGALKQWHEQSSIYKDNNESKNDFERIACLIDERSARRLAGTREVRCLTEKVPVKKNFTRCGTYGIPDRMYDCDMYVVPGSTLEGSNYYIKEIARDNSGN